MTPADTYSRLVRELQRLHLLENIGGLLGWDEQVNLPPASAGVRAREMSVWADLQHRESTRPEIGDWLALLEADAAQLDADQRVVVEEARRNYDRATRLPAEFVARQAMAQSEGYHAWKEARTQSEFGLFAPHLEKLLGLAREEAAYFGKTGQAAYDYFIDLHDPGLDSATIDRLFRALRTELVPLVRHLVDSPVKPPPGLLRGFPEDGQEKFLREVVAAIGFDFSRGRIDRSVHPFCGGNPEDTRMTTRYKVDDPLDSLSGAIHETGHSLYEQGLPKEHLGTALGKHVGMAVHESQSRLWENQVGRGRPFWQYWEPRFRAVFPEQLAAVGSESLFLALNHVAISPIRVDADEVTYNLHILLRFELEQRLFRGELAVADLPATWNRLSTEIIGHTPRHDREGCLQDVHWSGGMFGYFPSYCLGNMMAAQLWDTVRAALPGLEEGFARGEYAPLLDWLRENIHHQGRRYRTLELTRRVTGRELGPESLLRYLRDRYLPLYYP